MQQLLFKNIQPIEQPPNNAVTDDLEDETMAEA